MGSHWVRKECKRIIPSQNMTVFYRLDLDIATKTAVDKRDMKISSLIYFLGNFPFLEVDVNLVLRRILWTCPSLAKQILFLVSFECSPGANYFGISSFQCNVIWLAYETAEYWLEKHSVLDVCIVWMTKAADMAQFHACSICKQNTISASNQDTCN